MLKVLNIAAKSCFSLLFKQIIRLLTFSESSPERGERADWDNQKLKKFGLLR